ncbi:MAG: ATP-binding protein [Candidatus Sumerlaeota bacterium]
MSESKTEKSNPALFDANAASEREYAAWLANVEHEVIIPLKWVLLVLCVFYWLWSRDWALPPTAAFGLFFLFSMTTLSQHYFFGRDRITPRQVRPFVVGSYFVDGLFVCFAIAVDTLAEQGSSGHPIISDYFSLFILLVLRGFALFRTRTQNFVGFLFVSCLFFIIAWFQVRTSGILEYLLALQKLILIWGVMLLTQTFISLIAEQKEEEFRARERQLRSASLASLGDLSAGVAHEINNPIGIIKTYAEYLARSVPEGDAMQEDFQTIRNEAERCQEIVRRMLDFSNPHLGDFAPVDIAALMEELVSFVFHEGRADRVSASLSSQDAIPLVNGDSVQLKQAFMNILLNARQILSDVAEDASRGDFAGSVRVSISRAAGPRPPVLVEIEDNGPGIDPADAEKLFEPFYTRRKKGTGLGLSITRRIIEAHGGTIRVAPRPHQGGTVVTVQLPIADEEKA